ncbi:52 kDa repressor of the inhibitor of the protein kinase-like [Schistocerca cancellata]|uniref:52 kDa repressor of the inhibitor of the protein kinase-like n=1 Tax=Schistocerca cancellata TaxID=274614 RepID=UPI00211788F2|nr:52 kDa repressor of the inhibitor of the protein kinase-like [Schistocerca cancellata]XP_049779270.1 52 kDa repressor of the inhibitor of the protein kinase-like [Schistocerca cancellata]
MSQEQPLAIYCNCDSHRLTLTLSKAFTLGGLRNPIDIIGSVENFIRESTQRRYLLQEEIQSSLPAKRIHTTKKLCEIRWVERHDAILHFRDIVSSPTIALQKLCNIRSGSSNAKIVFFLVRVVQPSEFIAILYILAKVLRLALPLVRQLQDKEIDLFQAMLLMVAAHESLKELHQDSILHFHPVFKAVGELVEKFVPEIKTPRTTALQTNRTNAPAESREEYFRVANRIPFLDFLCNEQNYRFPKAHLEAACHLKKLIPMYVSGESTGEVLKSVEIYKNGLPCFTVLKAELMIWNQLRKKQGLKPASPSSSCVPNMAAALQFLLILPITTSTAETSFSAQRCIKTYLRNTLAENRLSGLALMHINRNVQFIAVVLEVLYRKFKRRLNLEYF